MTLKEKFAKVLWSYAEEGIIPQIEKISDNHAIGFAEWFDDLKPYQKVSLWSKNGEYKGKFDMDKEQLLKIYKK